jgi:chemotaxis response regulator CheB
MASQIGTSLEAGTIRLPVADDQTIVRKQTCALLATEPGSQAVGETRGGKEAIEQSEAVRPDIILMDLVMSRIGGLEASRPSPGDFCSKAQSEMSSSR